MTDERTDQPTSQARVIDLSVEVVGTPEEVWRAIATGPGISSWYVPTTVDEREGGATTSRFGEGPEMLVPGRVVAWEPPRRVVFDGGEGASPMAFEWLVEARGEGTCVVRLVNSGFAGPEWDEQFDAMSDGWLLFLHNLQLHLTHFPGQVATAALPVAMWAGRRTAAWARLTAELGVPAAPVPGERIIVAAPDAPALAGTVVAADSWRLSAVLDRPAPGTLIVACEGAGESCSVAVWPYLYGEHAPALAAAEQRAWAAWLEARAPAGPG
jgi:uncharacterized protein YndB with AHSA1/START domain